MSELGAYRNLAGNAVAQPRSANLGWWGMALLLATEAALFAALIAAYFYLRWYTEGGWPPSGEDPELLRPALFTAALVVSGATIALAQVAVRRGATGLLSAALAATTALGLAYLGIQAWDYSEKAHAGIVPGADVHASLTYVLTGAHAAHIVIGVLTLGWVLARAMRGAYGPERRLGISVTALYWLFMVALGVVIFLVTVITPRW